MLAFLDAKSREQCSSVAFGGVASHLCKLFLQLGHAYSVLVGEVGLRIERFALAHDIPHCGVSHQYSVEHRFLVVLEVVLREHAESFAWAQLDGALVGLQFAADGFQQG